MTESFSPTLHFRFVKRQGGNKDYHLIDDPTTRIPEYRVLQQFWCQYDRVYRKDDYSFDFEKYPGEWRDVPLVEE